MTLQQRYDALDGVLDEGQIRNWIDLTDKLESIDDKLSRAIERGNQKAIEGFTKARQKTLDMMYEYERLLYVKPNKIPEMDFNKFKMDEQVGEVHTIKNTLLEKKQINIQSEIEFTKSELDDLHTYGGKPHEYINGFLKNKNDAWNEFVSRNLKEGYSEEELIKGTESIRGIEEIITNMDSAMVKSPGLTQDTVLFSATEFDDTLRAGDFSSFAEFRSCSYQYESAESFNKPERYMVKIYAPEGQKGIAMNAKRSDGTRIGFYSHEHEFLLPRDQKFQVIEVDHLSKYSKPIN